MPRTPRWKPVRFSFRSEGFQRASWSLAAIAWKTSCGPAPFTSNSARKRGAWLLPHGALCCQMLIACPSASFSTRLGLSQSPGAPVKRVAAFSSSVSRKLRSGSCSLQSSSSFSIHSGATVSLLAQPLSACFWPWLRRCEPKPAEVCQPALATVRALRGQGCSLICWVLSTWTPFAVAVIRYAQRQFCISVEPARSASALLKGSFSRVEYTTQNSSEVKLALATCHS
mmetsp:Transcript_91669/g.218391  ORF Transcript_91669/g.218391 Transcript_91669/m.218391 type:complete len:227 (+) Transcript_91669:1079-1759(+)